MLINSIVKKKVIFTFNSWNYSVRFWHVNEANGWLPIVFTHGPRVRTAVNKRRFACRFNCNNRCSKTSLSFYEFHHCPRAFKLYCIQRAVRSLISEEEYQSEEDQYRVLLFAFLAVVFLGGNFWSRLKTCRYALRSASETFQGITQIVSRDQQFK